MTNAGRWIIVAVARDRLGAAHKALTIDWHVETTVGERTRRFESQEAADRFLEEHQQFTSPARRLAGYRYIPIDIDPEPIDPEART